MNRAIALLLFVLAAHLWSQDTDEPYLITAERESDTELFLPQASCQIIEAHQIESLAPRDMGELLESLAGLQVNRSGAPLQGSFISLRGSSAEQVMVLINGKPLNTAQGGGVDLDSLDLSQVERIEVFRGPAGARFGQGAMAGAINIVLKEDLPQWSLRGSYGSFHRYSLGLFIPLEMKDSPWSANAALSTQGLAGTYSYQSRHGDLASEERQNTQAFQGHGAFCLQYQNHQDHLWKARVEVFAGTRGVPGPLEFPSPQAEMEDRRIMANSSFEQHSDSLPWSVSLSMNHQYRSFLDPAYPLGALEDSHENLSLMADFQANPRLVFPNEWVLPMQVGISSRVDLLDSTALVQGNGSSLSGAIQRYSQSISLLQTWSFASGVTVYPALRFDWNRQSQSTDYSDHLGGSGSLAADWSPSAIPWLNLNGSLGWTYRMPSLNDLFWSQSSFAMGNPDLEPEEILAFEAGLSLDSGPMGQWQFTAFRQEVTQLILWTPGPGGLWRPDNLGKAEIWGLEGRATQGMDFPGINSFVELSLQGALLRPINRSEEDINRGHYLPGKMLEQGQLSLGIFPYRGGSLLLEGQFKGDRYLNMANSKLMDRAFLFHCTMVVQPWDHWSLVLKGQNLLDQGYRDLEQYPLPGRSFTMELQWQG